MVRGLIPGSSPGMTRKHLGMPSGKRHEFDPHSEPDQTFRWRRRRDRGVVRRPLRWHDRAVGPQWMRQDNDFALYRGTGNAGLGHHRDRRRTGLRQHQSHRRPAGAPRIGDRVPVLCRLATYDGRGQRRISVDGAGRSGGGTAGTRQPDAGRGRAEGFRGPLGDPGLGRPEATHRSGPRADPQPETGAAR